MSQSRDHHKSTTRLICHPSGWWFLGEGSGEGVGGGRWGWVVFRPKWWYTCQTCHYLSRSVVMVESGGGGGVREMFERLFDRKMWWKVVVEGVWWRVFGRVK